MEDPTYELPRIKRDPRWHLAYILSEHLNDNAPIGWSKYLPLADELHREFFIKPKHEVCEGMP